MKNELSKRQAVDKNIITLKESDFKIEDARWKPR